VTIPVRAAGRYRQDHLQVGQPSAAAASRRLLAPAQHVVAGAHHAGII